MNSEIKKQFEEHIETVKNNFDLVSSINDASTMIVESLKKGGKLLICGNGGSAADAQHIAAELIGRYEKDRKGFAAIALTTDSSTLTSWGNDDCFENAFARQVEGLGKKDDVIIGLSTSGNSENIIRALVKAKEMDLKTISFLGKNGGKIKDFCDVEIIVKSNRTARVQEVHQLCYHILCGLVEEQLS